MIRTRIAAGLAAGVLATTGLALAASPAGATTVAQCRNHALHVSATHENGATGHGDLVLRFKNHSSHTCSITGYPGLDALDKFYRVLKHAKRTVSGFTGGSSHGVQTIVVHPGHYASADVEWHNFNFSTGHSCHLSHQISVTAANTTKALYFARQVSVCGLQVHPTVAGRSGSS
jgi:hypothetical protein